MSSWPQAIRAIGAEARGADKKITNAIDAHVQAEQHDQNDDEDGAAGVLVPTG